MVFENTDTVLRCFCENVIRFLEQWCDEDFEDVMESLGLTIDDCIFDFGNCQAVQAELGVGELYPQCFEFNDYDDKNYVCITFYKVDLADKPYMSREITADDDTDENDEETEG